MNPFLASGIILILRWLQFIASYIILKPNLIEGSAGCIALIEDTKRYSDSLSTYCVTSHSMSDSDSKIM